MGSPPRHLSVWVLAVVAVLCQGDEDDMSWGKGPLLDHGVIAFIHLPKTGGTSLIMALARWSESNGLTFFHDHGTCDPTFGMTCATINPNRKRTYGLPTRRWEQTLDRVGVGDGPILFASHGVRYGSVAIWGPPSGDPRRIAARFDPPREPAYVLIVRDPVQRVVSLFRQFPKGHDAHTWFHKAESKLCGLTWQGLGVQIGCSETPSAADWRTAKRRVRDEILVLRTERYDQSAALLDAVVGQRAKGPSFVELVKERFRCFSDNGHDGNPGRRCGPQTTAAEPVDPATVFPSDIVPRIRAALQTDIDLTEYLVLVFEARLRQFGIA